METSFENPNCPLRFKSVLVLSRPQQINYRYQKERAIWLLSDIHQFMEEFGDEILNKVIWPIIFSYWLEPVYLNSILKVSANLEKNSDCFDSPFFPILSDGKSLSTQSIDVVCQEIITMTQFLKQTYPFEKFIDLEKALSVESGKEKIFLKDLGKIITVKQLIRKGEHLIQSYDNKPLSTLFSTIHKFLRNLLMELTTLSKALAQDILDSNPDILALNSISDKNPQAFSEVLSKQTLNPILKEFYTALNPFPILEISYTSGEGIPVELPYQRKPSNRV